MSISDKQHAPFKVTICRWDTRFKHGNMNLENEEQPRPPKDGTIPEMVEKIPDIVLHDRRVKVKEISKK